MLIRRLALVGMLVLVASCDQNVEQDESPDFPADRPNILLIVADDLGYADLGVHGSNISTPAIDQLAAEGVLFTQFHTAPMCAPSRAMLLSGNNNHVAGMARQSRVGLLDTEIPGYEGSLSDRIAPLPMLLRDAGYNTYTVGKWHLGKGDDASAKAVGFTRSYNLLDGAGTHFDSVGFFDGWSTWRRDGEMAEYPNGEYSTEVYTDELISFIEADLNDGKPFFAFAAYTSPHWPLQVPDEYLNLYAGEYDAGYDALRESNFESLKSAGIVPQDWQLPPRNEEITPWEQLSPDEQRREARKMELYASMVDNLDDHIARLLDFLKQRGVYDNTLIVFMSDNGAAGEDFYNEGRFKDYVRAHFDNAYDKMGTSESFVSYDDPWAEAGSAPFMRRKTYTRQGGIVAPMIMAGPGVERVGDIDRSYVNIMDLAPTFLDMAAAKYPDDGSVEPMLGESAVNLLAGQVDRIHDDEYVVAVYHAGYAYLRQGKWKIANLDQPFDEDDFELFNIESDPGETTDLATTEPEKYEEMLDLWRTERKRLGILLPEDI